MKTRKLIFPSLLILTLLLISCQANQPTPAWEVTDEYTAPPSIELPTRSPSPADPSPDPSSPAAPLPTDTTVPTIRPATTPTPDPTRPSPLDAGMLTHIVQPGEGLGVIATYYGTSVEYLMELNNLSNPDMLEVGQNLLIEAEALPVGPAGKLIPNSELVYGPACSHFDTNSFVAQQNGYLLDYVEEVEEQERTGPDIVQLVAQRFSVNPRLLLALLELKAGWVTESNPGEDTLDYPMGKVETDWDGLFIQLSWTANQLNTGYYGWQANWLRNVELGDESRWQLAPDINAGTAAVQHFLSLGNTPLAWEQQIAETGSFTTIYRTFFGDPFSYAIEPLIPVDLTQPAMELPWQDGELWYFSGGPHGGWGSGSAWAALDFVPGGDDVGCYPSDAWVRAAAPGRVLRSENGEVVVDMDDDGYEGTGWVVLYMHVYNQERVPVGTWLEAGDKIGHPSCEGGFSNGTHLHIARRYNGQWIETDGPVPFIMDSWIPQSYGTEYDGILIKGDQVREAWGHGREIDFNGIIAGP